MKSHLNKHRSGFVRPGLKIGVVGCGAIGSRIAHSMRKEKKDLFSISAVYDIDLVRAGTLAESLKLPACVAGSMADVIDRSDIIVEAVNSSAAVHIVKKSLRAGKSVLAMSVGRLLDHASLFPLVRRSSGTLLLPSGAVAGLDALKAAALAGIKTLTLTSCKPPAGFAGNDYIKEKGIRLDALKKDTVLFDGGVMDAVRYFPQNINVAASVALAAGPHVALRVRIIASPSAKYNSHEIFAQGAFGSMTTRTENTVCPDNPKTSYLAVLSGIRTLKGFAENIRIGT
ncbi:MAG: aspartate dehydrogenase domain-containing protein [Candidatus Omnitrophota bacterium]